MLNTNIQQYSNVKYQSFSDYDYQFIKKAKTENL